MSSSAFGPYAQAYAARLPDELDLLIYDEYGFAEALDCALERAYHCGPFLAAPIISDRRSKVAFDATRSIMLAHSTYWKRRECLNLVRDRQYTFDGKAQTDHEAFSKKEKDSISDVLVASDCVVLRSWGELIRLSSLFDHRPVRSSRVVAPPRLPVPGFQPRRGAKTIIVWAPELDALQASIFALAVEELKTPVVIACLNARESQALGLRAWFVEATDIAQLQPFLTEAAAIIDGAADDPASAIELATLGLPLAATFSSGAYEYIDGLYLYDAWDYRSILHVALAAMGGEPPIIRAAVPRPQDLADDPPRLQPPDIENAPLVSVIMSTLNRHGVLPRAIDSVARQTYPNVELVIVNDGGKPVDDLVGQMRHVTILNNERSQGGGDAQNTGFHVAQGKYVIFLSDDDYLFPTHVSRLVYALERTGQKIAAGMCADSYLEPGQSQYYDFIGTSIRPYRSTDPTVLRTVPHSMPAMEAVHRDLQAAFGNYNPLALAYDDYERMLALLDDNDCLWISHVVVNMDSRLDRSNFSGRISAEDRISDLRRIWSQYELPDRPDIREAQKELLELLGTGAPPPLFPLYRGVTRLKNPRRALYRLA